MKDIDSEFRQTDSQDEDLLQVLRNMHPELADQYDQMVAEVQRKSDLLDSLVRFPGSFILQQLHLPKRVLAFDLLTCRYLVLGVGQILTRGAHQGIQAMPCSTWNHSR